MMSGAWILRPSLIAQYVRMALGKRPLPIISTRWERVGARRKLVGVDRLPDYRVKS